MQSRSEREPQAPRRGSGEMGEADQARRGALSPRPLPSAGLSPAVDGGITLEKEISREELVAVLELYREVRGASSDVTRLLTVLSQMERHEVRGLGAAPRGGGRV